MRAVCMMLARTKSRTIGDATWLEGYTMHQDGYVLDVKCVVYGNNYVALKSNVKSRTCDKDPLSKLNFYVYWILLKNGEGSSFCIVKAYCSCKGG